MNAAKTMTKSLLLDVLNDVLGSTGGGSPDMLAERIADGLEQRGLTLQARKAAGWVSMDASGALEEFVDELPRLEIDRPTIVTLGGGDFGWLLVTPKPFEGEKGASDG